MTFNLHCHLHLPSQVSRNGPLHLINSFPFEGYFFNAKSFANFNLNSYGIIQLFIFHQNKTYILLQELRSSLKNHLTHNVHVMKNENYENEFKTRLNSFFLIMKLTENFKIIDSDSIVTKCILIEYSNLFMHSVVRA